MTIPSNLPPLDKTFAEDGDKVEPLFAPNTDVVNIPDGFPIRQGTPLGLDGLPVNRVQMNGVFNYYSKYTQYLSAGMGISSLAVENYGYPMHAKVLGVDGKTYSSLEDDNLTTPESDPSKWTEFGGEGETIPDASTTVKGITRYATDAEATQDLNTVALTPHSGILLVDDKIQQATTTIVGKTRYATDAEAIAKTSADCALTPSNLASLSLGWDGTWQAFTTAQRTMGVTYTNTTDKAIAIIIYPSVAIRTGAATSWLKFNTDGISIPVWDTTLPVTFHQPNNQLPTNRFFTVGAGKSYSISGFEIATWWTNSLWYEFR